MSVLGKKFEIKLEEPGKLYYREGLHDYVFPIYDQDHQIVIVAAPSSQRFQYFFGCYAHPKKFPASASERILPRLVKYFEQPNRTVRIFKHRDQADPASLYSTLFDERARAHKVMEASGFVPFKDFSTIELLQKEYGVEVCGIKKEEKIPEILEALKRGFPQWHFSKISRKEEGLQSGWKVAVHMFRNKKK